MRWGALLLALFVPSGVLACPAPSTWVASLTGVLPSGVHATRLAIYAFAGACADDATGSGTVEQRFWSWRGDMVGKVYGSSGIRIGDPIAPGPGYDGRADRGKPMQGLRFFKATQRHVGRIVGTWSRTGSEVAIAWEDGSTETWHETWRDDVAAPRLRKLELVVASAFAGATYLDAGNGRHPDAASAGFAFGGAGPEATVARPLSDATASYVGLIKRHNAWCGAPTADEPVVATGLTMPLFHATTNGVRRYVGADGPSWVFAYLGTPRRNPDVLARRVLLQTSHDWDGDGTIADDLGHTYAGLEILDAANELRGFVFADASSAVDGCDEDHTISSLYYLDATDCDALYGTNPTLPNEPCP